MAYLADINVLLAICNGGHAHHAIASQWLSGVNDVGSVVLCRMTQLGLCRLLSNRIVMGDGALEPESAWKLCSRLLEDDRFAFHAEARGIEKWMSDFLRGRKVSQSVWTDAYLAAFAASTDLVLVSLDRGFLGFDGVKRKVLG